MNEINPHSISNNEFRLAQIKGTLNFYEENYLTIGDEKPDMKYKKFYDNVIEIINTIQPGEEDGN